jgi:Thioredoxin domain-containing protein
MAIALYVTGGLLLLFLLMQTAVVRSSKKMKGNKITGLTGRLKELEKKGSKGIVYFFSPSCHACKSITPVIQSMKLGHKNIFDINVADNFDTAKIFGIKATPTTIMVKDGVISDVIIGACSPKDLEVFLK